MNDIPEGLPTPLSEPDTDLAARFERVETALLYTKPRASITTTDRRIFDKAQELLRENQIKPVFIRVTSEGFETRTATENAFREGLGEEKVSELEGQFGSSWVDEVIDNPDEVGVDLSSFVLCIEVDSDVKPDNHEYDKFSNETRGIAQSSSVSTILYAPQSDQIHTEFSVRSRTI